MPVDECCCNLGVELGGMTNSYEIQKLNTDANDRRVIWTRSHGATVNSVAIHPDGIVVGGARGTGNFTTRKYDPDGVLLWSKDHGGTVSDVAVDSAGNIITTGANVSNVTTRQYDADGNEIWTSEYSSEAGGGNSLFVDGDDNILETGFNTDTVQDLMRKVDGSDGSEIWFAQDMFSGCGRSGDVVSDGSHIYFIKIEPNNVLYSAALNLDGSLWIDGHPIPFLSNGVGTAVADVGPDVFACTVESPYGRIYQNAISNLQLLMIQPNTMQSHPTSGHLFIAGTALNGPSPPVPMGNLVEYELGSPALLTGTFLDSWQRGGVLNEIAITTDDYIYAVGTTVTETWT